MKELYKKISGTFLIRVLGLGAAFILQIILGRYLTPDAYGQYTIFVTYINMLSILSILGMDKNLIKEIAKIVDDKKRARGFLSFSYKVALFVFVAMTILIVPYHHALSLNFDVLHLFLILLLIRMIILIMDGFLQGTGYVVKASFYNVLLNNILKIVFFFVLLYLQVPSLLAAIYSFIVGEILTLALRAFDIHKWFGGSPKLVIPRNDKVNFVKYSSTMALIAGIGLMLQNVDKIMIANILDMTSVGIYKVAQNYVALIGVFISPFAAFWPVISKLYVENKIDEIQENMQKIIKIVSYLVVPMFFVFIFLSERLLMIFGHEYITQDAEMVLIILAFAFLIDAVSGPIGSILTMTKYAKYILVNNIICLGINITLNLIFIKHFGLVGVAVATGVSIIINNLIAIIEVRLLLGIFSYDYTNLIQLSILSIANYILAKWLAQIFGISNNYIYIVTYIVCLYLVNIPIIALLNRKTIVRIIRHKKLNK